MFMSLENQVMEEFTSDFESDWRDSLKCPLSNTGDHSNELYDSLKVGSVKNVLCLRLFSSSLYEIANGTKDGRKLMTTIFEDQFLRKIQEQDKQIYESIAQTVQHIAWKIRKAEILVFRRTREDHGWSSVRDVLIKILSDGNPENAKIVAGMSATILQDVYRSHSSKISFREDSPLLPKSRFNEVFPAAFLLFNDSISEYIRKGKMDVVYEKLASRLVYFYTRLAADTWRILVVRNGPKVQTEWFMSRTVESTESESSPGSSNKPQNIPNAGHNNSVFPFSQNRSQNDIFSNLQSQKNSNPHGNQKPLRKNL